MQFSEATLLLTSKAKSLGLLAALKLATLILVLQFLLTTIDMVCHKSYISMGRNFNDIRKYYVLSNNFDGYLKLLRVI